MKLTAVVIFIIGFILTLTGLISLASIIIISKNYTKTIGIVEKYDTKRVYKSGKNRYESTMLISYETERFGTLYTTMESHYPFRKVKDKLILWYDPNKPRNIKLPLSEAIFSILSLVLGIASIALVVIYIKVPNKQKAK